jgi:hypothetical protein
VEYVPAWMSVSGMLRIELRRSCSY